MSLPHQGNHSEPYINPNSFEYNRQPLPILQKRKGGAESYVSERLNRIRKQKAKISKVQEDEKKHIKQKQLLLQLKKNLIVSPNKVLSSQQIISSYEPFRKQLELLRKKPNVQINYEQLLSNLHPFSNAIRELGIKKLDNERKQHKFNQINRRKRKSESPLTPYLNPYRSVPQKKQPNLARSKDIIQEQNILKQNSSSAQIRNQDSYFLSIGKINLLDSNQKVLYNNQSNTNNGVCMSSFGEKRVRDITLEYYAEDEDDDEILPNQQTYIKRGGIKLPCMELNKKINSYNNIRKVQELLQENSEEDDKKLPVSRQNMISQTIDQSMLIQRNNHFHKGENDEKSELETQQRTSLSPTKRKMVIRRNNSKKLSIPFQTYYYRSLLWKINYSNGINVEIPPEYQHRLKAYIGKGNNSALIRGLVKRRIWFSITDRIQEANFIWTQLKSLPYFRLQPETEVIPQNQKQPQQNITNNENLYHQTGLFTKPQTIEYNKYIKMYIQSEERTDQRLLIRNKFFKYDKNIKMGDLKNMRCQNHLINNYVIGNKKALFHTMSTYYTARKQEVFDYLPLTFHVKAGLEDPIYFKFLKYYYARAKKIKGQGQESNSSLKNSGNKQNSCKNIWIVKPGENSNRGNGIKVCLNLEEIKTILKKKQIYSDGSYRTYILQQYIENPMLYHKRKFDIRHYIMITCVNGYIKGYWYQGGYVRTTSTEYNLKTNTGAIHLTNDAVQKNLPDYGKYEKGNKISYDDLDEYLWKKYPKSKLGFKTHILPKMKQLSADIIRASSSVLSPNKLQNNFELFGLDFMLDSNFKLYLIEVNSNPCLQISCPLLGGIIPRMMENILEITMDTMYPPPARCYMKGVHYQKNLEEWNRFQLVYDEKIQGRITFEGVQNIIDMKLLEEQDDVFEDDGEEWDDDN